MEKQLLKRYKEIFTEKNNNPAWATHKTTPGHEHELVHCPIPFVGKDYSTQKTKILLYASAENLSGYNNKGGYLDDDNFAITRHRYYFNKSIPENLFFPNVHIQPVNDGVLPIVTLYVYLKYQYVDKISPSDFLERISLANYCKYTKQTERVNIDYASDKEYLSESHDYVKQDLSILQPDIIIIPKSIYYTDYNFINENKGNAKILPIYQINARNVNLRIKKYPATPLSELNSIIAEWYENLANNGFKGTTKENFLSVFKYLDECISKYEL